MSAAALPHPVQGASISSSVFYVCGLVIFGLTTCWSAYGVLAASGRAAKPFKLSLLCLSFAACSWAMNVLNKALVTALGAPSLVTGAQMLMTVVGTLLLARKQLTFNAPQMLTWSFVPLLFFGMLVSSFFSFQYLTLSMMMVIRNLSPIVTLPVEMAVMPADKQPIVSRWMLLALMVMLAGAFAYGGAITFSWVGVGFAILNMVLAIADRVAQRKLLTSSCQDLTTETCVLLNNLLGCIPTALVGYHMGEVAKFDSTLWFRSSATLLLILSGVIGSGICYFAIAVQREISATSFMVLQNSARMCVVVAGILIFGDPVDSYGKVVGLLCSFVGALWYGRTQLDAAAEAKRIVLSKAGGEEQEDPEKQPLLVEKVAADTTFTNSGTEIYDVEAGKKEKNEIKDAATEENATDNSEKNCVAFGKQNGKKNPKKNDKNGEKRRQQLAKKST
jgi:drug/metabolite transporter (DMT)-like permease